MNAPYDGERDRPAPFDDAAATSPPPPSEPRSALNPHPQEVDAQYPYTTQSYGYQEPPQPLQGGQSYDAYAHFLRDQRDAAAQQQSYGYPDQECPPREYPQYQEL